MLNGRRQESDSEQSAAKQTAAQQGIASPPAISLPKGGGAIRGIGEKFTANPVTGTGSMSVPIATSPGRSGFGPQLSLSYDSGAGNGPFGFGWNLSLPAITRKTDKGLPQYHDAEESDVYLLSGAEDLVPVLQPDGSRFEDDTTAPGYTIHRYRPRIEGLFARIERWTNQATGEIHWRSISRDNITTLYGKTAESCIADPDDPQRIFSWLICESYDDKGNAIVYEYAAENEKNVDQTQVNERNRVRTANRYLKRIKYGNRVSRLIEPDLTEAEWMFEVVFDYGEHDADDPKPDDAGEWLCRHDPFSSYRAGFEVRTYRLCQRVLMFHHFPAEDGVGQDCLVRSTDFVYRNIRDNAEDLKKGHPVASFIASVTQSGYKRQAGGYLKKSLPPLQFEYSQAIIHDEVTEVDAESLENLPYGLDGATYQWVDLDGEGLSGILTEQGGEWFYKRNLSPAPNPHKNGQDGIKARFGPLQRVLEKPSLANLGSGGQQLLDLAGDGQLDLAMFAGPTPGFYERTQDGSWEVFRTFTSLPNLDWNDPNLRFVDLTGDSHADILITEDEALTWYLSLAEAGFAPAEKVRHALEEEKGPRLVFADGTQSIYLADLSGDGLTDLARIRNGEVCYWPSLGYGRFGAKVTMDKSPWFDAPDQFNQQRIRLADIDGSGTTDIIYLSRQGVHIYFNHAGNAWSRAHSVPFPAVDNLTSVQAVDLLGNGTACLVWSSPLPGNGRRPMRYIDLMGGQKPHLLVKTINNLGAETHVHYAPSTRFYLEDKEAGKPWITRLPFLVHVVERVETYDHISRNRFVTRYAYHHGYFDGVEREFRGFGMVEQWDTEEFATLSTSDAFPVGDNIDEISHVPPVHTRTWFHTGVYMGRDRVSNFFAGLLDARDQGEYYREPAWRDDDDEAKKYLLDDTVLPDDLTAEEEREACRALKGSMLRQEVYALDATDKAEHPYTVTEQNFTVRRLQPRDGKRHAVFFTHPREAINYHYERNPADPRVAHALTLEVDDFGNVLKEAAVGYGRRQPDSALPLQVDRDTQTRTLITYTENSVTNPIDDGFADDYRTPLPCETRTYELTGHTPSGAAGRFQASDFVSPDPNDPDKRKQIHNFDSEISYEQKSTNGRQRRLIEQVRILYRPDDLGVARATPLALLPLGTLEPLALPGESYKLAFTPRLLTKVYQRPLDLLQPPGSPPPENLLSNPDNVLGGQGADRGGYVDLDGDGHWWMPSGRVFYSPNSADAAEEELTQARQHFYVPRRYRDPFHTNAVSTENVVTYDAYDLLLVETRDALGNVVTVETKDDAGNTAIRMDYRVLQPYWMTDPNGNRTLVAFDALGMVVGTAVMGKPPLATVEGDSLDGFEADLAEAVIIDHLANPLADPQAILRRATTRLVYDLFAYQRTKGQPNPQPAIVYTLARETHDSDPVPADGLKIQHSFSYSDGFGREIQKKIQAEPGPLVEGGPIVSPRWVGSGWTIFNNKGKPVRQYEPFFSDTYRFEFGARVGVSPILFYDPVERVVATLHPNHTWEKVVFDPWRQETWDVNDTVTLEPQNGDDVKGFFVHPDGTPRLPAARYQPTWHALRTDPAHATEAYRRWPDPKTRTAERNAAAKAAVHAKTPSIAHFDALGRVFLTLAHNGLKPDGTPIQYPTRVHMDIEGNQREVRDAIVQNGDQQGRIVMRYDYDMLGNRIHQASMEAGERWMLNDVAGNPIRAWDSRGHAFRTAYDPLRRPLRSFVMGADPANPSQELLTERLVYGEQHPQAELHNLRGQLYLHLDQAGVAASEDHDFKGNLLRTSRRLAQQYTQAVDWRTVDADHAALPADITTKLDPDALEAALAPRLEADTFTSHTTYDALSRPLTLTTPDNSVVRPTYNEANLLERVEANVRGDANATAFVTNIDYDAKGQRTLIDYGNGVRTTYAYDQFTFRLVHLLTRRNATDFPDDCPEPSPAGWPGCQVQNLHYAYDPIGNITHIRDEAQQTIYFRNRRVEPSAEYTYDAIYRLIKATGREHLGQTGGQLNPPTAPDAFNSFHTRLDHPGDGNAMGTYVEQYVYDAVGNIMEMGHHGAPSHPGWTRTYTYNETSQLESGRQNNRLSSTTIGTTTETYRYEGSAGLHGNITFMPHLPLMQWDYKDQLQATAQQVVNNGGAPETTYYVYDAGGQRVRKVTERAVNAQQAANGQQPTRMKERFYLGGFEVYREYNGDGSTVTLERETLHIMDDKQRIALVETQTADGSLLARARSLVSAPKALIKYQFGNHLGSASLELDDQAQIISYEEYTPYGSTSYQAVRSQTETPKRYRYTGKERDEESGLYYHGARYYTPWVGGWTSADPAGLIDGPNLYRYSRNNPIILGDPNGTDARSGGSVENPLITLEVEGLQPHKLTIGSPTGPLKGQFTFGKEGKQTPRIDPHKPETGVETPPSETTSTPITIPPPQALSPTKSPVLERLQGVIESFAPKPSALFRGGSELRSSVTTSSRRNLLGPLYYSSRTEYSPSQLRLQWGQLTEGHRIDSYSGLGLKFGNKFSLEAGWRSTYASGRISPVEQQRVGFIQATIAERIAITYFNDHRFAVFPMGGDTDQGDTAGFTLNLSTNGLAPNFAPGGFQLSDVGLHLHMATGIPNQSVTSRVGSRTIYPDVAYNEISRGVLSLSAKFTNRFGTSLTLEAGVDSGAISHLFQNVLVHRNMNIPEFPKPSYVSPYLGIAVGVPF